MYGSLLTFLIAIVIQALAPRAAPSPWTVADTVHMLAYPLGTWTVLRICFRRLMAQALHGEEASRRLRVRFASLVQDYQTGLLIPYALLIYGTPYLGLVAAPAAEHSQLASNLLGVLPFVGFLLLLWWEAYPLQGVLLGKTGNRSGFVLAHARMELAVLVPWFALTALSDLVMWLWPAGYRKLQDSTLLQLFYAPLFLILVGVFLPILVKTMWGCEPVPAGALRGRLDQLCRKLRLRVGEVLYWPLLEGRVMTAGIVGLVPRFRYLLVTPALVEILAPEELDGVVAHEAGHVRYRHLWHYLLFFIGYVCLVAIFFRIAEAALAWWGIVDPESLRRPRASLVVSGGMTVSLLALLAVYFRVLFGAVSRAFERQADAHALEVMGDPGPLVSALERISRFSGDIRDLPSWHHGSIAERVSYLLGAARNPELLAAHHRHVRRVTTRLAAGIAAATVVAVSLNAGPVSERFNLFVWEQALQARLEQNPGDAGSWFVLGNLLYEGKREGEAEGAYQRAVALDPDNPEALNNLAWLYATAKDPVVYRPERALALAEMAVALKPTPHILDTLAEARFRVHDPAGALAAIGAALQQEPPNLDYYLAQRRKYLAALEQR